MGCWGDAELLKVCTFPFVFFRLPSSSLGYATISYTTLIRIGSLHEISIAFRHTWLESVFHADSHGIFYFFFKSTEMCVFLM
jgi:hypothetical protein